MPGETGLVVPPENPRRSRTRSCEFFASGVAPRLRQGVERVRASHSWDALANETLELGDELRPKQRLAMKLRRVVGA